MPPPPSYRNATTTMNPPMYQAPGNRNLPPPAMQNNPLNQYGIQGAQYGMRPTQPGASFAMNTHPGASYPPQNTPPGGPFAVQNTQPGRQFAPPNAQPGASFAQQNTHPGAFGVAPNAPPAPPTNNLPPVDNTTDANGVPAAPSYYPPNQ